MAVVMDSEGAAGMVPPVRRRAKHCGPLLTGASGYARERRPADGMSYPPRVAPGRFPAVSRRAPAAMFQVAATSEPGNAILEIGPATGFNAALLTLLCLL